MRQHLWLNGELLPKESGLGSVLDHGLHYGTGVFEGIRCYETQNGPAVFRLEEHLERMSRGAKLLGIELNQKQLADAVMMTLDANCHRSAYIRPIAYYSSGGLGLDVDPLNLNLAVATLPWKSHLGDAAEHKGVRLTVSKYSRIPAKALPPAKLCGVYVNSVVAKLESKKRGFDEALFLDNEGLVVECTGENVFAVYGDEVVAVKHPDALDGITRATVMEMCGAREQSLTLEDLLCADAVFLTGTSAEVAPVSELDGRKYGQNKITRELQALYQDVVHGRSRTHEDWLSWAA